MQLWFPVIGNRNILVPNLDGSNMILQNDYIGNIIEYYYGIKQLSQILPFAYPLSK